MQNGFLVAVFFLLFSSASRGATDPLDSWQLRRQLGGSATIAYGNGRFVAASGGAGGPFLEVSTNGADWRAYLPPESGTYVSLKFANGNFLLLLQRFSYPSTDNGMVLYSSVDGVSWVLRRFSPSNPYGIPVSSVGGGNGIYVMAASDLSASTDLVNWRQAVLGSTGIQEFAYGRGLIIGTPWYGGSGLVVSGDGATWEYLSPPDGYVFSSIEFANGRFAAFASGAGDGSTPGAVAVSPYGYEWTNTVMDDFTNYTRLCSGNDRFFLVSSSTNAFYSSTDALSWQSHSFGTNVVITDVAYGANTYVAVGSAILQSGPVSNPAPVAATLSICSVPGIRIHGPAGQAYQIEYTDNLSDTNSFVPLTNVVSTTSPFFWLDPTYTNGAPRFYRALTRPAGS